jgi:hypothetical protein
VQGIAWKGPEDLSTVQTAIPVSKRGRTDGDRNIAKRMGKAPSVVPPEDFEKRRSKRERSTVVAASPGTLIQQSPIRDSSSEAAVTPLAQQPPLANNYFGAILDERDRSSNADFQKAGMVGCPPTKHTLRDVAHGEERSPTLAQVQRPTRQASDKTRSAVGGFPVRGVNERGAVRGRAEDAHRASGGGMAGGCRPITLVETHTATARASNVPRSDTCDASPARMTTRGDSPVRTTAITTAQNRIARGTSPAFVAVRGDRPAPY